MNNKYCFYCTSHRPKEEFTKHGTKNRARCDSCYAAAKTRKTKSEAEKIRTFNDSSKAFLNGTIHFQGMNS